jgi:hypothetical protein
MNMSHTNQKALVVSKITVTALGESHLQQRLQMPYDKLGLALDPKIGSKDKDIDKKKHTNKRRQRTLLVS